MISFPVKVSCVGVETDVVGQQTGGRDCYDSVVPGEKSAGIVMTAVLLPLSLFGSVEGCRFVLNLLRCLYELSWFH